MKKALATLYQIFLDRGIDMPYFRTIGLTGFLLFIHLVQLTLIFDFEPLLSGKIMFKFPGTNRSSPDEKPTVNLIDIKPLAQANVTNMLQAMLQRPEPTPNNN